MTSTTVDRFNVSPEEGIKAPCRMATTANVTLSGLQTIDGIVGAENDRVLVKEQTTATDNGIYLMKSTDWQRAPDWNDNSDVSAGVLVGVAYGTTNADSLWSASFSGTFAVGTTEVTFKTLLDLSQVTTSTGTQSLANAIDTRLFVGAAEPSFTVPYMKWAATADDLMRIRNAADSGWVDVFTLSTGIPADTTLAQLSGVLTAANKIPYATGIDTAGELDFLDEDDMASDSATAVPSQQSVKAYVDAQASLYTSVALLEDTKTSGTAAGSFTSGSWVTRDLNTEVADPDGIVSLAGNQFQLAAGTYLIEWSAPAFAVNRHQTRLYNASTATAVKSGTTQYDEATAVATQGRSFGQARVTIASSTSFEIQHQCQTTRATNGLGIQGSLSAEVYTQVKILKEA